MEKTIRAFNIRKTALSSAMVTVVLSFLMALFMLISSLAQHKTAGVIAALLMPVLYFILIYLFTALYCWFYNLAVRKKWCAGITFTLVDNEGQI